MQQMANWTNIQEILVTNAILYTYTSKVTEICIELKKNAELVNALWFFYTYQEQKWLRIPK